MFADQITAKVLRNGFIDNEDLLDVVMSCEFLRSAAVSDTDGEVYDAYVEVSRNLQSLLRTALNTDTPNLLVFRSYRGVVQVTELDYIDDGEFVLFPESWPEMSKIDGGG